MRWPLAIGLLIGSLAVSALLWVLGFPLFFLLFFLPFGFFPLRGARDAAEQMVRACPSCGYRARAPDEGFCPRDGEPLMPSRP